MKVPAWRYYLTYFRGERRMLALAAVTALAQAVILFPIGLLVQRLFDEIIPAGQIGTLVAVGAAILAAYLINEGLNLALRVGTVKTTKQVIMRLRGDVLNKAYSLPRAFYGNQDLAKLHARFVQDTERIDNMSVLLLSQLLPAVVTTVILSVALIWLNPLLFSVLVLCAPVVYVVSRRMGARVRAQFLRFRAALENYSKGMLFVLQMMDLTRMQAAESYETARQQGNIQTLRIEGQGSSVSDALYISLHKTIVAIANVLILLIGGAFVALGQMTLGALLSFYVVVALLKDYLLSVLLMGPHLLAGNEALRGVYEFLQLEDHLPYRSTRRIAFQGKIEFQGVDFQYGDSPTLRGIDLIIEPPCTVALIGPNGAGKSTIINLLLGFYRPPRGSILADGQPFDELDMSDLRRQIGIVAQDPIIFPGTVAENISYGTPEATAAEIRRAAEIATADEFIRRFPQGYETLVGERGMLLSGGQRQRIAIARALLRRPALLILDEPTNHLDDRAIHRLMENLKRMSQVGSIVIISHDRDVVREADTLYLLEEGRIVARGLPESVLQEVRAPGDHGTPAHLPAVELLPPA